MTAGDAPQTYGDWTEQFVRAMAVGGGHPDFVFRPTTLAKGSASREVGDSLVWAGRRMLVVSVKSRHPTKMGKDDPDRATSWLDNSVKKACAQIDGTVRMLLRPPASLVLVNERGIGIPWHQHLAAEYAGVVVINYTPPEGYVPAPNTSSVPCVCLHAADWRFLNSKLWSSSRLINYLMQRAQLPQLPLGSEKDLFAEIVEAEQLRKPFTFTGPLPQEGKWPEVAARFPEADLGAHPDHKYVRIVDAMIAGMGEENPLYATARTPLDYMNMMQILDDIPPLERVDLGMDVLERTQKAGTTRVPVAGLWFPLEGRQHKLVVFLAYPGSRDARIEEIQLRTAARHRQLLETSGAVDLVTLGIATEPYPNEGRSHDYVLIRGPMDPPADVRASMDSMYPMPEIHPDVLANFKQPSPKWA